jgi:hypothetical protein
VKNLLRIVGSCCVIGLIGYLVFKSRVSGAVTLSDPTEQQTWHLTSCWSGQSRGYYGIAFSDDRQHDAEGRIEDPVDGEPHVVLDLATKNYAIAFYKNDCPVWDVDVHHGWATYNGIWSMTGHARFTCSYNDDGIVRHATGDVQFGSCH